ncbi:MAG: SHOCT domain-containing protein [Anaerolineae bacterium]|jgi:putative membrane protein
MMMGGGGWVVGIVMLLVVLLVVGALVIGGIWLVGRNTTSSRRQPEVSVDGAMEILRRRYASGEISREVYEAMREHLSR